MSRIEEPCGKEKNFVVILKYAKREEAMKKILDKCEIERTISGILIKGRYKGREVSVFRTGKLIIKGSEDMGEVEGVLEELLV